MILQRILVLVILALVSSYLVESLLAGVFSVRRLIARLKAKQAQHTDEGQWATRYDENFSWNCSSNQTINFLGSVHSNTYEDRRWVFDCRPVRFRLHCSNFSDYVNSFDSPFVFNCPENSVLNGMDSYHDNHFEDRKFKFLCCSTPRKKFQNCITTDYINNFDEAMAYSVPPRRIIRGVISEHDNHFEDRRWKLRICRV